MLTHAHLLIAHPPHPRPPHPRLPFILFLLHIPPQKKRRVRRDSARETRNIKASLKKEVPETTLSSCSPSRSPPSIPTVLHSSEIANGAVLAAVTAVESAAQAQKAAAIAAAIRYEANKTVRFQYLSIES